ncbi:hypothetical protein YB2330_002191 [Saitoella coloradoensis]
MVTPTHYSPGRPIHPRGRTASGSRFSEHDDDDDVAAHAPLNPHPAQGEAYEFTEYPIQTSGSRGGIGFEQRPSYVSYPSQMSQVDIGLGHGQEQTYSSHSYDDRTVYDPEPADSSATISAPRVHVSGEEGQSIHDADRVHHGFGIGHHHDPNLPPRSRDVAHEHPIGPRPWWKLWSVTPMTATLFLMLVLLMAGLITATGQDLFYQYLDGHDVISSSSTSDTSTTMSTVLNPATLPQIWINRTSQLFIFLYKTLLVASIALAFDQVFWYTVRSTAISIGEIDALWNLTSNPVYLFHIRTLMSGKLAAVLAVVSWMLPLSAIFNGGALTLRTTFDPSTSVAGVRTLALDSSQGYVDFSENWLEKQPSGVLARYAMRAMVGGAVVPPETVGGCTGNCSYELGFWGPGYRCAEATTSCPGLTAAAEDADYWAEERTDTGVYEFWVQSTSYNFCVRCVLYNTTYNISYVYTDGVPNVTISMSSSTTEGGALDAGLEEEYVRVVASSAMSADVTYATPTFVVPTSAFLGSSASRVRSGSVSSRGSVASGSGSASASVASGSASSSASVGSVTTAGGSASQASATSAANSASGTNSAASASASVAASGTSGTATQTSTATGTTTDTGIGTSLTDTGTMAVTTDTATTSPVTTENTDTGSSSAAAVATTPTTTDSVATTTTASVASTTTTPATTAVGAITSDTAVAAVTTPAVAVTTAVTTTAAATSAAAAAAARKKRHLEIQNFRRGLLAKRTSEAEFLQGINSTLWSFFNTIGIKDTFVNALSGSIVPTNGSTTTVNNTAIANTNLATLAVIGGHNYLTFPGDVNAFMTGLEQLMQNITVSTLAMPAQDGSDPVMQQTTITSRDVRTVYSYTPHNRGIFWMSYGLGLFFASLCVAAGAYCLHKNHSVGSRNFSQVVVSTRNPTLDDVVLEGAATGTLPKTKVQLGRLAGAAGTRPVSQVFPMFGLKEEIVTGEGEKSRTQSA